ncbi:MAG: PAS domain-containing protein [Alphaproteobacteria bacterium]|nr:PAS domain-containing protein [Alphaproteobacteria bacterium]
MTELRHMNLLLVEDEPGDAFLVQSALSAEVLVRFEIDHVATMAAAKAKLAQNQFDAVLLDLSLPDSHGLGTVRSIVEAAPSVPVVVLTGLDDSVLGYKAVQAGAQDYQLKGQTDGDQLRRAILYAEYRKASQITIERLHQKNEQILRSMGEGVIGLDRQGLAAFLNPAILSMTGFSREEIMGHSPHTVLKECRLDGAIESDDDNPALATLKDGEVRLAVDMHITHKNGTRIPVECIVTAIREADEITGAVVAYRDVTDRQQAFDVLQRQLGFHQLMIDALPLPLFYLDHDGLILGCNNAFAGIIGRSSVSFLGRFAYDELPVSLAEAIELGRASQEDSSKAKATLDTVEHAFSEMKLMRIRAPSQDVLGYVGILS